MNQRTPRRVKLLRPLADWPHRYALLRLVSQSVSIGLLLAVPLTGLARVDVWRGGHYVLGSPAELRPALAGVIIGIAAMYVVTFLSNVVAGRLFCGWGCPVAQVNRFGEQTEIAGLSRRARMMAHVKGALFSGAFVVAMGAWWVDLRVLVAGDGQATLIAWGLLVFASAGAYAHGKWWRWGFCKQLCPIGLYYSFMAPARYFGIHYRNSEQTCLDCDACDHVCPVDLQPRDLMAPASDRGGLSIADAPGHNHCIECGDCVRACEWMIDKRGSGPVPLELGWFRGPQRDEPRDAEPRDDGEPIDLAASPQPTTAAQAPPKDAGPAQPNDTPRPADRNQAA